MEQGSFCTDEGGVEEISPSNVLHAATSYFMGLDLAMRWGSALPASACGTLVKVVRIAFLAGLIAVLAACQGDPNEALIEAAKQGDADEIPDLLEAGVDPNLRDEDGSSVLMLAVVSGKEAAVRGLLEGGADPQAMIENGSTALHVAAGTGDAAVVRTLIERGADVNSKTNSRTTSLMMAALWGHLDALQVLLEAGAHKNLKNEDESSALMLATVERRPDIVRALLDAGANPRIERRGLTPLMIARREGYTEIEIMLSDALGLSIKRRRKF